jgi:hypothetical protein
MSISDFKVAKPALVDDLVIDFRFENFGIKCFVKIILKFSFLTYCIIYNNLVLLVINWKFSFTTIMKMLLKVCFIIFGLEMQIIINMM